MAVKHLETLHNYSVTAMFGLPVAMATA